MARKTQYRSAVGVIAAVLAAAIAYFLLTTPPDRPADDGTKAGISGSGTGGVSGSEETTRAGGDATTEEDHAEDNGAVTKVVPEDNLTAPENASEPTTAGTDTPQPGGTGDETSETAAAGTVAEPEAASGAVPQGVDGETPETADNAGLGRAGEPQTEKTAPAFPGVIAEETPEAVAEPEVASGAAELQPETAQAGTTADSTTTVDASGGAVPQGADSETPETADNAGLGGAGEPQTEKTAPASPGVIAEETPEAVAEPEVASGAVPQGADGETPEIADNAGLGGAGEPENGELALASPGVTAEETPEAVAEPEVASGAAELQPETAQAGTTADSTTTVDASGGAVPQGADGETPEIADNAGLGGAGEPENGELALATEEPTGQEPGGALSAGNVAVPDDAATKETERVEVAETATKDAAKIGSPAVTPEVEAAAADQTARTAEDAAGASTSESPATELSAEAAQPEAEPEPATAGADKVAEAATGESTSGGGDTVSAEAAPEAPEPAVTSDITGPLASAETGTAVNAGRVAGLAAPTAPTASPLKIAPLAQPGPDNTSAATSVRAPSFDLVRVAPDGGSVIAGRAQPNETVDITADGKVIATTRTNSRGEFVAMLTAPESEKPLALGLIARSDTGEARVSTGNVLILRDRRPDPLTGEASAEAPIVVREVDEKIEIVQPAKPPIPGQVVIDKIGYDRKGDVEISGRGKPKFLVRLYINGKFTEEATIDVGGGWELKLSSIEAGRYTLRVDEVGPGGKVASRTETPFQRIFPELIPDMSENANGYYTVQPGNNLWTIAKNHYGRGIQYWQIFYANETQIRDPDLIYPGQIFVLPDQRGVTE